MKNKEGGLRMLNFKKSLILVLMGILIVVFSTTHSNAQGPPGHAKGAKKGWTKSDTPPGWQKGKKTGWGGGEVPTGWQKGEKRGWEKEEKIREKAREAELEAEKEETEALEEQEQERGVRER